MNNLSKLLIGISLQLSFFVDCRLAMADGLASWLSHATTIAIIDIQQGRVLSSGDAYDECKFQYEIHIEQLFRPAKSSLKMIVSDAQLEIGSRYFLATAQNDQWNNRIFVTDVPDTSSKDGPRGCKSFDSKNIVRSAELRPIERNQLTGEDWVSFPPDIFPHPSEVNPVRDMERIELVTHRIEWPTVPFFDHFRLKEIVKKIQ